MPKKTRKNGIRIAVNTARMPPEISPNVHTIFFMGFPFSRQDGAWTAGLSSSVRVLSRRISPIHTFVDAKSRDQPQPSRLLDGLDPTADVHLLEDAGGMRLHRV